MKLLSSPASLKCAKVAKKDARDSFFSLMDLCIGCNWMDFCSGFNCQKSKAKDPIREIEVQFYWITESLCFAHS